MFSVGTDLVHIPGFAEQLARPGTRFTGVFSAAELRLATQRFGSGTARQAEHLAGRWAAKEAFIKAWSEALYGRPPVIAPEAVDFSEIEVRADAWGRVGIELRGAVNDAVDESLGQWTASLSISHDGDYATATVLLVANS